MLSALPSFLLCIYCSSGIIGSLAFQQRNSRPLLHADTRRALLHPLTSPYNNQHDETTTPRRHVLSTKYCCFAKPPHGANQDELTTTTATSSFYQYKDDCFGFMLFLGGLASSDVIFSGTYIVLSLLAAAGARAQILPRDKQRPSIADRRVAGGVALGTLVLTPLLVMNRGWMFATQLPEPSPQGQYLQLAIGLFSIATTLVWDIRWRDRFDYPNEA